MTLLCVILLIGLSGAGAVVAAGGFANSDTNGYIHATPTPTITPTPVPPTATPTLTLTPTATTRDSNLNHHPTPVYALVRTVGGKGALLRDLRAALSSAVILMAR